MKPAELVDELRSRGYHLRAKGDRLVCRGRIADLAESVLAAMKANKPAILQLLADEQEAEEFKPYHLARCRECRRIQPDHYLEGAICDECRLLPAPPEQEGLFTNDVTQPETAQGGSS